MMQRLLASAGEEHPTGQSRNVIEEVDALDAVFSNRRISE
jgi:hypothetical protein